MQLIGVFGTGRSGTTLFTRLFDGAPGVFLHPSELDFLDLFDQIARHGRHRLLSGPRALNHLDTPVPTDRLLATYGPRLAEFEGSVLPNLKEAISLKSHWSAYLAEQETYTASQFVPGLLNAFRRMLGADPEPVMAFKTVETPYVAEYESRFPDMKFVHVMRDPLKTWASLKRTITLGSKRPAWHHGGDSFSTLVRNRYRRHLDIVTARSGNPRHHVVRYEDLVADPRKVICDLCERLEINPPAEPDRQTVLGRHFLRVPDNASQPGVTMPEYARSDLAVANRYADVVDPRETAIIGAALGHRLHDLGYDMPASLPVWRTGLAWILPQRWEIIHNSGWRQYLLAAYSLVKRRRFVYATMIRHALRRR